MNMQFSNYNKKYTVKPAIKKAASEKLPRAEFAEMFIRAYDGSLKIATGKAKGNGDIHEMLARVKKLAEDVDKDEH